MWKQLVLFICIIFINFYYINFYYNNKSLYFYIAKTAGLSITIFYIFIIFIKYIKIFIYFELYKIHIIFYIFILILTIIHIIFHILNNSAKRFYSGTLLIFSFISIPIIYLLKHKIKYHKFYWYHTISIYLIWIVMTYHSWNKYSNSTILLLSFFIFYYIIIFIKICNKYVIDIKDKLIFDNFIFIPIKSKIIKNDKIIYITIPEISYEHHPFSISKFDNQVGLYIKTNGNWCKKLRNYKLNNLTIYWDGYYKPFSDKIKELIEYENCVLIISGLNFTTITYILSKLDNKKLIIYFFTRSLHEMYVFKSIINKINVKNIYIYITCSINIYELDMIRKQNQIIYNKKPCIYKIIRFLSCTNDKINILCFTNTNLKNNIKNIIKNFNNINLIN